MPSPQRHKPGDPVAVLHGRDTLLGMFVGPFDHPVFGRCADVSIDGTVRRFCADRVRRAKPVTQTNETGRTSGEKSGPASDLIAPGQEAQI